MTTMSAPASVLNDLDASVVHAALSPVPALLADRRALYRLAAELLSSDIEDAGLPDDLLDNPLVRFRLGEALAGRHSFSRADLVPAVDTIENTHDVRSGPARLRVLAGPRAHDLLADGLAAIATAAGVEGPLGLLTESDGERFHTAMAVLTEGLGLARAVSPTLVDDLLAHVELLAILDSQTASGVVSASSRFFPGLVVIDAPATPLEVAEALVHEGAHEKFFDFAMTHSFLSVEADSVRHFQPSWSTASGWPFEQVVAAWHAYSCMAQFAVDAEVTAGARRAHRGSLLPVARQRAAEIGAWLVDQEHHLLADGRWLLHSLLGEQAPPESIGLGPTELPDGCYALDKHVRMVRSGQTGRMLVARAVIPPELYWLNGDVVDVIGRLGDTSDALSSDQLAVDLAARWNVDTAAARDRLSRAMPVLTANSLLVGTRRGEGRLAPVESSFDSYANP
jgi:hypothetical protein